MNRRLRVIESGYGRDKGWFVEVGGHRLAALTDCQWEDMFWDSYRVEPLATDPLLLELVLSDEFWNRIDIYRQVYRSRAFDEVAPNAFPACRDTGTDVSETGRVIMRGLYLAVPEYPWDGVLRLCHRLRTRPAGLSYRMPESGSS
jgi:hypothetical protein